MFARYLATLFGTAKRTPIRNTRRTRLTAEALESREVPAAHTWTGTGLDGDFYNPDNWDTNLVPIGGDSVYFTGASPYLNSQLDCKNLGVVQQGPPPEPGEFRYTDLKGIHITGIYSGTVTFTAPHQVDVFELKAPGALAQPNDLYDGPHLTVTGMMTWTNGTLNNSESTATVYIQGATAEIAPENGGSITTGSTLVFQATERQGNLIPSFGTFEPGTVTFANGEGVEVGSDCGIELVAAKGTITFSETNASEDKRKVWINKNGWATVTGGDWVSQLYVRNDGGKFTVQDKGHADVRRTFQVREGLLAAYGQFGETSVLLIQDGSTLDVPDDETVYLGGGKLATKPHASVNDPAKIIGYQLLNEGAAVEIYDPGYPTPGSDSKFGMLTVDGDLKWTGGVYRPSVGWTSDNEETGVKASDTWYVTGTITLANGATGAKLGPRPVVNAGTRNLATVTWNQILTGDFSPQDPDYSLDFETVQQSQQWTDKVNQPKTKLELKHQ